MSLITTAYIILIIGGISDFMTTRTPILEKNIYQLVLLVTTFIFTIKYYYGPDITTYVPYFDNTPKLWDIFLGETNGLDNSRLEFGFGIFCSLCKTLGLSFWGMTAVIQLFYFYSVNKVLQTIDHKRTFALMIVIILDAKINYTAYRQCLSVSFFYLMVLAISDHKNAKAIVYMLLATFFHRSAFFILIITILTIYFHRNKFKQSTYQIILVILCLMLLIPLSNYNIFDVYNNYTSDSKAIESLTNHLVLNDQIQIVFILYFIVLLTLQYINRYAIGKNKEIESIVIIGIFTIALLYQYYYLLNRIRPYFVIFIVTFAISNIQHYINEKHNSIKYAKLLSEITATIVVIYLSYHTQQTISYNIKSERLYNYSTIFDLLTEDKNTIVERQMHLAHTYWDKYYIKRELPSVAK